MVDILQTIFSDALSSMEVAAFDSDFPDVFFFLKVWLTIIQQRSTLWFGTEHTRNKE